jgi:hypothetical protein
MVVSITPLPQNQSSAPIGFALFFYLFQSRIWSKIQDLAGEIFLCGGRKFNILFAREIVDYESPRISRGRAHESSFEANGPYLIVDAWLGLPFESDVGQAHKSGLFLFRQIICSFITHHAAAR